MLNFICCDSGQFLRCVIAKKAQIKLKCKLVYGVAMTGLKITIKKAGIISRPLMTK